MKLLLITLLSSWMMLTSQAEGQQCSSTNQVSQSGNPDIADECGAVIDLDRDEEQVTVQALYANLTEQMQEVKYMLEVSKTGPSGTSNSSQGGKAKVKAGEEVVLSSSSVDYRHGNTYVIVLSVYEGDILICKTEETFSYE